MNRNPTKNDADGAGELALPTARLGGPVETPAPPGAGGLPPALSAVDAALAQLAAASKRVTDVELRRALGERFSALSRGQREELRAKVQAVRFAAAVRRFISGRSMALRAAHLHEACQRVVARTFSRDTLLRWCALYRKGGARALVDGRGRPRGHMALDPLCLVTFGRARKGGASVAEAHRRTRKVAERRQLSWPRSPRTVAAILAEGVATIDWPKPPPSPDPNAHLVKDLSAN